MPTIRPTTTIRALLSDHPQAYSVLIQFGMCPDCQADPPPVPLSQFAMKHCDGKLEVLLDALRTVIAGGDYDPQADGSIADPT